MELTDSALRRAHQLYCPGAHAAGQIIGILLSIGDPTCDPSCPERCGRRDSDLPDLSADSCLCSKWLRDRWPRVPSYTADLLRYGLSQCNPRADKAGDGHAE